MHPIVKIPEGLKAVEHKGSFVLAEGEFTGHKHLMTVEKPKDLEILQDKEGRYYFNVKKAANLTHEEHKPLVIEPGLYKMNIEREFDYFKEEKDRVRQVID